MKTTLQFLGLDIHSSYYRMLEQHVDYWQRLTAVTATDVVMERQPQGKAAYRVQVRLEVSGGDFHTGAIARTLKAALLLASRDLETQIQTRKAKRVERRASNHHAGPAPAGRVILEPLVLDGGKLASRLTPAPGLAQPQRNANG
jgi:ribosome-associated translation inhibitor RaiA